MNISAEMILGVISVLTAAVGTMWLAFTSELKECKEDRKTLHARTESLHIKMADVSMAVGRMEGRLAEREPHERG